MNLFKQEGEIIQKKIITRISRMKGAVHKFLADYFNSIGLSENTLTGKIKMRSIRIQISLKGVNLSDYGPDTMDSNSDLDKVKTILANLNLPTAV